MSCVISFDNSAGTGVFATGGDPSTNGIFELLGYSTTLGGTYGAGGSGMPTNMAWGATVDTSAVTEGFYKYKYKSPLPVGDPCYGEVEFIIPIVQGTNDMPADASKNFCSGDGVINLASQFATALPSPAAVNPATFSVSGTLISQTGYSAGAAGNPTDDTFDTGAPTTYPVNGTFIVTMTPITITGYTNMNCLNCQSESSTLTVTITEAFSAGTPANITACSES